MVEVCTMYMNFISTTGSSLVVIYSQRLRIFVFKYSLPCCNYTAMNVTFVVSKLTKIALRTYI